MMSHGVDKWYKVQCVSGIPGIRLGMEKHSVVEETAEKDDKGGQAHEMGCVHGNVWDLLACDWASNEDSMIERTQKWTPLTDETSSQNKSLEVRETNDSSLDTNLSPLKIVILENEAREVGPGDMTLLCRAEGPTVQNAWR